MLFIFPANICCSLEYIDLPIKPATSVIVTNLNTMSPNDERSIGDNNFQDESKDASVHTQQDTSGNVNDTVIKQLDDAGWVADVSNTDVAVQHNTHDGVKSCVYRWGHKLCVRYVWVCLFFHSLMIWACQECLWENLARNTPRNKQQFNSMRQHGDHF